MRAPEADFEVSRIKSLLMAEHVAAWLVTVEFLTRLA